MENESDYKKIVEENKKLRNLNNILFRALSTFVWWVDWSITINVESYLPEGYIRNIWADNTRYIKEIINELERQNLLWGKRYLS